MYVELSEKMGSEIIDCFSAAILLERLYFEELFVNSSMHKEGYNILFVSSKHHKNQVANVTWV